jgi:Transposase DNA-binding/Transposase DDE domain
MDSKTWAEKNFSAAELGDIRRTQRLLKIASKLVDSPESTLSSMMGSQADNKAAQRFFANEDFDYQSILSPVIENTVSKFSKFDRILLVQDSSHLNYDTHAATSGLGHIGSTDDKSFQGIMMHWTLALCPKGECLGLSSLKLWRREKNPRKIKMDAHQTKPIQEKESFKWIEPLHELDGQISSNTQAVWISDRESDIYEYIDTIINKKQDFVIRARNDRVVADEVPLLKESIRSSPVAGTAILEAQGKKIKVAIQFCDVGLVAQRKKGRAKLSQSHIDHEIFVVRVSSPNPKEKLEWILLTSLRVENLNDCMEIIWLYKQRWHIEMVHKALKSGFQVEDVYLNKSEKLEKTITIMLPAAIQVYWLANLQKVDPSRTADQILTKNECMLLALKNKKDRNYVPTIKEAWLWIGLLGGFRGSKNSAPPGQITFWRGLLKLKLMVQGAEIFAT